VAEQLLELFRGQEGRSRSEIDADVEEAFGTDPSQLVHQGLVKLLEDRCEFEVVSGHPPEELRAAVFRAAAAIRTAPSEEPARTASSRRRKSMACSWPSSSPRSCPAVTLSCARSCAGVLRRSRKRFC